MKRHGLNFGANLFAIIGIIIPAGLLCMGFGFVNETGDDNLDAAGTITMHVNQISDLYSKRSTLPKAEFDKQLNEILLSAVDIERLAPQLLQEKWKSLSSYEKSEFKNALLTSIRKHFVAASGLDKSAVLPKLTLESEELKERFSKLEYSYFGDGKRRSLTVFLLKEKSGEWKISNAKDDNQTLLVYYYKFCEKLLDDYSFEYLLGDLLDEGYVVLEDFESTKIGDLPRGWTWKGKDDHKNKPYEVLEENGNHYLAAKDRGESVILGKDVKWNLKKYHYVSFQWRGHDLPAGGDERYGKSVDSGAGIYFIYKKKLGLIPESIKYVWSTTLSVGSAMRRSGTGRPWMVVAESGRDRLGEWHTYTFDLYEAYKKTFGGDPPDEPIGIGILSDANSTDSKAFADYDNIRALKSATAGSGVDRILDAE